MDHTHRCLASPERRRVAASFGAGPVGRIGRRSTAREAPSPTPRVRLDAASRNGVSNRGEPRRISLKYFDNACNALARFGPVSARFGANRTNAIRPLPPRTPSESCWQQGAFLALAHWGACARGLPSVGPQTAGLRGLRFAAPDSMAGHGSSHVAAQVALPFRLGKMLQGVTEHGARHGPAVRSQERLLAWAVPLADFSPHPSHGLMDEVMRVGEQPSRQVQRRAEVPSLDPAEGRDDGDAPIPESVGAGQPFQNTRIFRVEMGPDDVLGRHVDEVPAVDVARVRQIGSVDGFTLRIRGTRVPVDEDEEREQSFLVPGRV